MALFDFLEPEEWIGKHWHRMVGGAASYPAFPDAAARLDQVRGALGTFFRALGGDGGVELAAASAHNSAHRLSLRQRLGMDAERIVTSRFDGMSLLLPPAIDLFPEAALNRDLYFWLTASYTIAPDDAEAAPDDPLQVDLNSLHRHARTVALVCSAFPAIVPRYRRLCEAVLALRPQRHLPPVEAAVETAIVAMLHGRPCDTTAVDGAVAPSNYRPFLVVPMWGDLAPRRAAGENRQGDEEPGGTDGQDDTSRRHAERRTLDQADREDSLILNNMEKILGLAEAININRAVDDDDPDNARKAADDLDEITISPHTKRAATKLALDLDLPPEEMELEQLNAPRSYPEWDFRRARYHRDYCAVVTGTAPEEGEDWYLDADAHRRVRTIRRQFEALRPKREVLRKQIDGFDLDMDAVVRNRADLAAGEPGSAAVYLDARNRERDMSVALLVDLSLSTDAWIAGRRVLDVEKEAALVFAAGLDASGDDHAIYTFTSRRRKFVRVQTVKTFGERFGPRVRQRISALKPGYYTRIGAALRHMGHEMEDRPNRYRLLILLTDGKPNDLDHYEGRYAVEDTRKAVQELRRDGIAVFGVTVDNRARDYFPYIFGKGAFQIVGHPSKLSAALPKIYRQLVK